LIAKTGRRTSLAVYIESHFLVLVICNVGEMKVERKMWCGRKTGRGWERSRGLWLDAGGIPELGWEWWCGDVVVRVWSTGWLGSGVL
jgi:hypothetical protein